MNRLERLYAISEELRRAAPRPLSASRLAERFEVSRRTIERDVAALRYGGLPLHTIDGPRGGVALATTPPRTLLSLSPAELTALILAATNAGTMPFGYAASSAIGKLLDALPADTRVQVDDLRRRIRVVPLAARTGNARVRATVEDAVRTGNVLAITYRDRNGVVTRRHVDPVGFHGTPEHWSLVAWCHLRDGGRLFHLERIVRARLTRERAADHDYDEVLGWVPERGAPLTTSP
jgi:predicted DNA-binding transcriptional regulator YafY